MYDHILVPLDGSPLAEQVLPHIRAIATPANVRQITLLKSLDMARTPAIESGLPSRDIVSPAAELAYAEAAAAEYLEKISQSLQAEGYKTWIHVSRHDPATAIVDFATIHHVDLITIATHGRHGLSRWLFGSVTQKVLEATAIPVLVIRPKAAPVYKYAV